MNKLLQKYKKLNPPIKAGLWFTICNFLQRGIQFLVTPLYTRLLSTEGYGTYSVFLTWINLISMFATLSLANGVFNNGMVKYSDDQDGYTSSMQGLSFCTSLIVFIIYSVLYIYIKPIIGMSYSLSAIMFLVIYFQMSIQLWSARQKYDFKYKTLVFVTVMLSILTPLLGLGLFYCSNNNETSLVLGYSLANILVGIVIWIVNVKKGGKLFNLHYWSFAFSFNVLLIPHYLSNIILGQSDRIMINMFCGSGQAGIYTLAYQVSLVLNIVTMGIVNSLSPWTYKKLKSKEFDEISVVANKLVFFLCASSLIVLLLAPEIVLILGTSDYIEAVWIIPPVVLSVVITFAYGLFVNILFFYEETKGVMIGTMVGAIANVILNALLIPRFGFIAAGYTTVVGYILIFCIDLYFTRSTCLKYNVPLYIYNVKHIICMIVFLAIICGLILLIYQYTYIRILIALLLFLLFVIFGKRLVKSFVKIRK